MGLHLYILYIVIWCLRPIHAHYGMVLNLSLDDQRTGQESWQSILDDYCSGNKRFVPEQQRVISISYFPASVYLYSCIVTIQQY